MTGSRLMEIETDTYPTPKHGWTCFHCGETFEPTLAGQKQAQQHFGPYIDSIPGCRLRMRAGEKSLLRRIRWLERQYRQLRYQVLDEDTDKDRTINRMIADHATALRREEETGYARGLADARKEAESALQTLRRETIEEAAKVADAQADSEAAAGIRARAAGRFNVGSHRDAGIEVAAAIATRIRSLSDTKAQT